MSTSNILVYVVRHDLRVSDNPILHHLASTSDHGFTHILPLCVLLPHQIEVSGFLKQGIKSPFPEAKSDVGRYWRCGPHRARFIAQSFWNLKDNLEKLGNDLTIRIGPYDEVLKTLIEGLRQNELTVGGVWTIGEEGTEEKRDETAISETCSSLGVDFRTWIDEKYFIDDQNVKLDASQDLPDVFTTYRKMMEPLREKPSTVLPTPSKDDLPKPIEKSKIPHQDSPFEIPSSYEKFEESLLRPINEVLSGVPPFPEGAKSAHPFKGGEESAHERLEYLIKSGSAYLYKDSRNGLLGSDFSTKLSAYLAQGCITARQVHDRLMAYEDGKDESLSESQGYGEGENEGTKAIRFELLWRDYMRLCNRKFKEKLFLRSGFRDDHANKWKSVEKEEVDGEQRSVGEVAETIRRVFDGTTGMGLIDASQRELLHTGYTSNRARQNVASFLAKHLSIDWRYGAEWYEMLLVDYDVSSNWANWQYVSGVGNDPRGEARIFNPVKQAFDYDKDGEYVRCWLPEVQKLEKLENVFQAWTTPKEDWDRLGLTGLAMAENPIKKIEFSVEGKPKASRRPFVRRRGPGRGGSGRTPQPSTTPQPPTGPSNPNGQNENGRTANRQRNNQGNQGNQQVSTDNPRGSFRGGRGYGRGYQTRGYRGFRGGYRGGRGPAANYSQPPAPMQTLAPTEQAQ
ncbi:cryptochrome [Annulohypoxylon maeteangense]|uniref:cryptochrome n=1 Tax=Annulohypoxylon maeteangense TaxID=1927788 RepID=UPI00200728E4|nr:cryptochrome [Annulohypoxylon maeteangense]KAI0885982.1 cryptochrome [Annulohypoxylon maeteangense]